MSSKYRLELDLVLDLENLLSEKNVTGAMVAFGVNSVDEVLGKFSNQIIDNINAILELNKWVPGQVNNAKITRLQLVQDTEVETVESIEPTVSVEEQPQVTSEVNETPIVEVEEELETVDIESPTELDNEIFNELSDKIFELNINQAEIHRISISSKHVYDMILNNSTVSESRVHLEDLGDKQAEIVYTEIDDKELKEWRV